MRTLIGTILVSIVACNAGVAAGYRGRFSPDAEYVLSGNLAADLPPLPDVPFGLEAPRFRDDLLSKVPPVGVHLRVVLSPRDIGEIKANIAKGEDADVTFRVCLRELRNKAASPKPMRDTFGNAPWGGIGVIAAKGLLALLTDAQRQYVRSVISRATSGKYTTGMEIPGHFFINNHMSMGAEFYTLLLSIEGEEGFDARAAEQCVPRLMDKLTYDISPDGVLWSPYTGPYMDAYFRNMVLVDGYPLPAGVMTAAGCWSASTVRETPISSSAAMADGRSLPCSATDSRSSPRPAGRRRLNSRTWADTHPTAIFLNPNSGSARCVSPTGSMSLWLTRRLAVKSAIPWTVPRRRSAPLSTPARFALRETAS